MMRCAWCMFTLAVAGEMIRALATSSLADLKPVIHVKYYIYIKCIFRLSILAYHYMLFLIVWPRSKSKAQALPSLIFNILADKIGFYSESIN